MLFSYVTDSTTVGRMIIRTNIYRCVARFPNMAIAPQNNSNVPTENALMHRSLAIETTIAVMLAMKSDVVSVGTWCCFPLIF